jgi:hypothetical protein
MACRNRTKFGILDHGPSGSSAALDVETDGRRAAPVATRGAVESILQAVSVSFALHYVLVTFPDAVTDRKVLERFRRVANKWRLLENSEIQVLIGGFSYFTGAIPKAAFPSPSVLRVAMDPEIRFCA